RRGPAWLQDEARALAARMGLRKCPGIWLVPGAVSPMLWVMGRMPRLLFPTRLLDQLDREQRATLLVHQLAHYRRRDHWVRILEALSIALYWWHPVMWWARHELHEAEEQCCDAWVVCVLAVAELAYATALLQTVAFVSQARCPLPVTASGIGQVRHLRRRLTMIMQGKTPRSLSWAGFLAIAGLGLVLLPLQAQAPRDKSEREATIEKLKKALKQLEEEERGDQEAGSARKKASPEELDKAKAEVADANKEVEARRRELQTAERRHLKALNHLAELEGKPAARLIYRVDGRYVLDGKDGKVLFVTPDELKKNPGQFKVITPKDGDGKPYKVETKDGQIIIVAPPGEKLQERRIEIIKPGAEAKSGTFFYQAYPGEKGMPQNRFE